MNDIILNHFGYQVNNQVTGESLQQPEHKLPNNQIASSPCSCQYSEVTAVLSSTSHWAEWLCVGCGKHRGWIEHPNNTAKRDRENLLIDSLLASRAVTGWDATFLRKLREKRKRSPRQREILQSIVEKVGGVS